MNDGIVIAALELARGVTISTTANMELERVFVTQSHTQSVLAGHPGRENTDFNKTNLGCAAVQQSLHGVCECLHAGLCEEHGVVRQLVGGWRRQHFGCDRRGVFLG